MSRILFVDDEPRILRAYRRVLHKMRDSWEIGTAIGGEAALEQLRRTPADVVVSDLTMPGMDGAEFMSFVREEHPSTVRILLSGNADMQAALRCIPSGHQFLSKPCNPDVLERVLRGVLELPHLSGSPWRAVAAALQALPIRPSTFDGLRTALSGGDAFDDSFADLATQDSALAAKILQLASSDMFGTPKPMSVAQAARYLGTDILGSLVTRHRVLRPASSSLGVNFCVEAHQMHAVFVASVAARLIDDPALTAEAYTGGLLHDIGQLVLAACGADLEAIELATGARTAREAGSYLLSIWGLPEPIVDVVAFHETPHLAPRRSRRVTGIVHVADVLAKAAVSGCRQPDDLDLLYVDEEGLRDVIPRWWAMLEPELASHAVSMRRAYKSGVAPEDRSSGLAPAALI